MRLSIRWWLSGACALVAAVTAIAGALYAGTRAEDALRTRAGDLGAGAALAAAIELSPFDERDRVARNLPRVARERGLSMWLFDANGELVSSGRSRRIELPWVPKREDAVAAALAGNRFISTSNASGGTTVGLPAGDGALLVFAPNPDLRANVGIVQAEVLRAAAFAVLAGGLVGLAVAILTARRLRRIADAATSIGEGNFDTPVHDAFGDEVGDVARAIEATRLRLKSTFGVLRLERARLRRLLERLQEGVIAVDGDGNVEFANRRARLLLQHDLVSGEPLPDVWSQLSLREFARRTAASDESVVERRLEIDEDRAFLLVGLPPRRRGDGVLLVVSDVSERERRERAERQFVTNAAHELRTPVAAISGAIDVLQAGAKEIPEERDLFLSHIERASERLARLAQTLLVLARVQTREQEPPLVPVLVRPLLEEVADAVQPRNGVPVEVDCDDSVVALADENLMHHALLNLTLNAIAHTERGRVVLAGADGANGHVTIEVRDTGKGIPPDEQPHVFERFYRANGNGEGFGLGLAIVRQAVQAQKGSVTLESIRDVGTTVRVDLMRAEEGLL